MQDYETIYNCILCNGNIKNILSLGKTPLANEFLEAPAKQDLFPLNLMQCQECNHIQLDTIVNQSRLYKNYVYVSGTNATNIKHFENYANKIINRFNLEQDDLILDIGSNDGTFLKFFDKNRKYGIDPAENLAPEAKKNGVENIVAFFNEENIENIKKQIIPSSLAKIITCNNMFAHNKDLFSIVRGVKQLLHPQGTFIFENSYLLDILDNTIFDLIYHEHMHHHHLIPLIKFFDKLEMKIYDVERLPNHGGSIRVYVCKKEANFIISQNVIDLLELEKTIPEKLITFVNKINQLKEKINILLNNIKNEGKSIGIFAYPAKATTFVYGLGIDIKLFDFVVDSAILKQNKYIPGGKLQVFHPNKMYQENPDYMLILGWNFAESIINNHKEYKGKWIIPLTELEII